MILRQIVLESVRCFRSPIAIGPLAPGITVLHGPNATGKSTFLGALERGLFDHHACQGEEIKRLVPWGAEVAPRVTIDFEHEGVEYRIEKVFLRGPSARLFRRENERFEAWKDGDAAVEFVRDLLGGRAPGRGATKPAHRGMGQVLFQSQGAVVFDETADLSTGAEERLRATVGSVSVDSVTRSIEERIAEECTRVFTDTGRIKEGSPLNRAQEALKAARSRLAAAHSAHGAIDDFAHRVEEQRATIEVEERGQAQLERDLESLRPHAAEYKQALARKQTAERSKSDAQKRYDDLARQIAVIRTLGEKLARAGEVAHAAGIALDQARNFHNAAIERRDRAAGAREARNAERDELLERRRAAADAAEFDAATRGVHDRNPRLERWKALARDIEALEAQITAAPAPTGPEIGRLRDALAEERSAVENLAATQVRIRIRAITPLHVESGRQSVRLGADETGEFAFDGAGSMRLRDIAEIEISGRADDVAKARERAHAATKVVDELTRRLGSRDPNELEERRAKHKGLLDARKEKQARRDEQLRPGETVEKLKEDLAHDSQKRDALLVARPTWRESPPDAAALRHDVSAAERAAEQARSELDRDLRAREGEVEQAARKLEQSRAEHTAAETKRAELRGQLAAFIGDGLTDEEREAKRLDAFNALQHASDALTHANEEFARFTSDPADEEGRIRAAFEKAARRLPELRQELGRREQALATALSASPYATLAHAEEEAAETERAALRLQLEADATRLLRDELRAARAEVTNQLMLPITERVLPRIRVLVGPQVERVTLDEQFRPTGVAMRGKEQLAELQDLSFGTRDQLSLLVRMGLGEVVAEDTRLPAVLDDPLVHADRGRVRRLLGIFEDVARHLQLLILTCRPEDYGGLRDAKFIDIAGLEPIEPAR